LIILSAHNVPRDRIFKSLVGGSPVHCTWVVTGSSMATYWANLGLAPVNGFSILSHLSSVHLPTRVGSEVLERARRVLRQEFSTLPEPLLQTSDAHTVAELVFYATEWDRLPAATKRVRSVSAFCMDTLADKVYPEVRVPFLQPFSSRCYDCLACRQSHAARGRSCPTFGACWM
jgi:hypothetical protein